MKRVDIKGITQSLTYGLVAVLFTACGGGNGVENLNGLSDLPSSSTLMSTSPSSNAMVLKPAVEGTENAPTLAALAKGDEDADQLFWDGLLADNSGDSATCPPAETLLWGSDQENDEGKAAGMSGCRMTEGVYRAFEPVTRSGTSLCYMQNLPSVDSVDTSDFDGPASELFNQQTEDHHVRVEVADPEFGNEEVNIVVKGSDEVGANQYHVDLYFCDPDSGDTTPRGLEQIRVDKSTGEVKITSMDQFGENDKFRGEITAHLTQDGNTFVYDHDKEKTAVIAHEHSGDFGKFKLKADIRINDGQVEVKMLDEHEDAEVGETWNRSQHSIANFIGEKVKDVSFTQGAFTESNECTGDNCFDDDGDSFSAAVEFKNSLYVNAPNNPLKDQLIDDLNSDEFYEGDLKVEFTELEEGDYDCSATPDVTVEMDFQEQDVQKTAEQCEADGFGQDSGDYCWTQDFQEIEEACHS